MTEAILKEAPPGAPKEKLFSRKNGFLAALAIMAGFSGAWNHEAIGAATSDLSRRMTRVQLGALALEFSRDSIQQAVPLGTFGERAQMNQVADTINVMSDAEIVRLLNVGLLDKLCEFELGDAGMRQGFASDLRLRDLGLVKIEADDGLRANVLRDIKKTEVERKQKSDNGYPRICYRMILTDPGHDVRTALIFAYANNFTRNAGGAKQNPPAANLFAHPQSVRQASR